MDPRWPASRSIYVSMMVALVLVAGAAIPFLTGMVIVEAPHYVLPDGTPVEDTAFAQVVSEVPDLAMFPLGPKNQTEDTIFFERDFGSLISVNQSSAALIALEFLSQIALLGGRTWSLNSSRYDSQGIWSVRFIDAATDMTLSVYLNAISGRVFGFAPFWTSSSLNPFVKHSNSTAVMSPEAIIDEGVEFLRDLGYTLSPHAVLLGPVIETRPYYLSNVSYVLRFFQVVDGCLVDNSLVEVCLDIETGQVQRFRYMWTYVEDLPVEEAVSPTDADQAARSFLGEKGFDPVVTTAVILILTHLDKPNATLYRLDWLVIAICDPPSPADSYRLYVRVYPLSGRVKDSVFAIPLDVSLELPPDIPLFTGFGPLLAALAVSGIVLFAVKLRNPLFPLDSLSENGANLNDSQNATGEKEPDEA